MSDLISRQAVLDLAERGILVGNHNYKSVCNAINDLPSVTPTERTARWTVSDPKWGSVIACSNCGRVFPTMEPYCGNCGRRMMKPIENESETTDKPIPDCLMKEIKMMWQHYNRWKGAEA